MTLPAFKVPTEAACRGKKLVVYLSVPCAAHLFLKSCRGLCPCPLQSMYTSVLLFIFIFLWLEKLVEGIQEVSRQQTWHEHCQGLMASSFKPCLEMGSGLFPSPSACLFLFFFLRLCSSAQHCVREFPNARWAGESWERRDRSTLKLLRRWGWVQSCEVQRVWPAKGSFGPAPALQPEQTVRNDGVDPPLCYVCLTPVQMPLKPMAEPE